jgi:hypothetical protein
MTASSTAGSPRRRRWPWILLAALVLIAVAGAILIPVLLDVERHRGFIEAALRDATGWDAALGEIDVSVLRGVALTVAPARLDAPDRESHLEVESIDIRGRLLPLLRGRLEILTVQFVRPRFELVRADADAEWQLPIPETTGETEASDTPKAPPASEASDAAEPGADEAPVTVSIGEIAVRDGTLRVVDRSVEPPWIAEIGGFDLSFRPATGALDGEATLGGGTIAVSGQVPDLSLELDEVSTDLLAARLGADLVRVGGAASGIVSMTLPDRFDGELTLTDLHVMAGEEPFREAKVDFGIAGTDRGMALERFELNAEGASLTGSGALTPDLDLTFELPSTSLESALAISHRVLPLPLDVRPPGQASAVAHVDMPAGGELSLAATGSLDAATFVAGDFLPPATDVATRFTLSPAGSLDLEIERATVGGGPLTGTVRVDSIDPPGHLVFEGRLADAGLGELLGGLVEGAPGRIAGPVVLVARMDVDLGAAVLDANALAGKLELGATAVTMPGWELETAIRARIQERLGALAALGGGGGDLPAADKVREVLERMGASIDFDSMPWRFETLELVAANVEARGGGTFDPFAAEVDLNITAHLTQELTARYVERHSILRGLVGDDGRIEVPLRIRGPVMRPKFDVDVRALRPLKGRKALEGLLDGLLDRD